MRLLTPFEVTTVFGGAESNDAGCGKKELLMMITVGSFIPLTCVGGLLLGGVLGGASATTFFGPSAGPYGAAIGMCTGLYGSYRLLEPLRESIMLPCLSPHSMQQEIDRN